MRTVTLEMDDKEYNHLINIYTKQHSVKIINDVENDDDFKIDKKICLDTLKDIKEGNKDNFSEITNIDAHISDLENEINSK